MACGKPSGNPAAIASAADAIERYADGIDDMFFAINGPSASTSTTIDLSAFWRGTSADSSADVMSQYRVQLFEYSRQLRAYADSLHEYAQKLSAAQQCTIYQILIWVFLIVFSIAEIICGFFFGGIIEGMFTALFGALAEGVVDVVSSVGALIGDVLEFMAPFSRIAANVVEAGSQATEIFGDIGATGIEEGAVGAFEGIGGVGARVGLQFGIETGIDVGSDALTSAVGEGAGSAGVNGAVESVGDIPLTALRSELADIGAQVTTKLASFLEAAPKVITDQVGLFIYKAIYNTAEWYFQELVIRFLASLDPNSGGFAAQWNADDEKAETLSIISGMVVGSLGFALTKTFVGAINKGLINLGFDFGDQVDSVFRAISPAKVNAQTASAWLTRFGTNVDKSALDVGRLERSAQATISEAELASIKASGKLEGLGDIIKRETGTEVAHDVLNDVMENVWDYAAILSLYPAIRGEDFDWKELWWYVVYGIVESLIHAPVKHLAGSITNRYVGNIFPNGASSIEKNHLELSETAKNIGDFLIADGLSIFRKVVFDPIAGIGSFYDYLHGSQELEDDQLSSPMGAPIP